MTAQPNMEEKYIKERWEDQYNWLDAKSGHYKKKYHRFKFAEIIFAALIPFLAVLDETDIGSAIHVNLVVAALGVSLTIIGGMMFLFKYHELWIQYRSTAEAMKVEKILYDTRSIPYNGEDPFHFFVGRIESILANENSKWIELVKKDVKLLRKPDPDDLEIE